MKKWELVQFKDGMYGVRRGKGLLGIWEPEFVDLKSPTKHLWRREGRYFTDCKGTREVAVDTLTRLTDEGEVEEV